MKSRVLKIALLLTAIYGLALAGPGCGLLDSSDIWIDLPDQSFEFSLDADLLKQAIEAELGVSLDGLTKIPAELDLQKTFAFELPPERIDLSDEEQLKDYIAAGKVNDVKIKYVQYTINNNTLNLGIPSLEMWMDQHDAVEITDSSEKIAVTKTIEPGWSGTDEVSFTEGGRQKLSDFLMSLKFCFIGRTEITIDTNVDRMIPTGVMDGIVKVGIKFSVDPL